MKKPLKSSLISQKQLIKQQCLQQEHPGPATALRSGNGLVWELAKQQAKSVAAIQAMGGEQVKQLKNCSGPKE
jgi:hypothetical protein